MSRSAVSSNSTNTRSSRPSEEYVDLLQDGEEAVDRVVEHGMQGALDPARATRVSAGSPLPPGRSRASDPRAPSRGSAARETIEVLGLEVIRIVGVQGKGDAVHTDEQVVGILSSLTRDSGVSVSSIDSGWNWNTFSRSACCERTVESMSTHSGPPAASSCAISRGWLSSTSVPSGA
jgi:hypothetical protein